MADYIYQSAPFLKFMHQRLEQQIQDGGNGYYDNKDVARSVNDWNKQNPHSLIMRSSDLWKDMNPIAVLNDDELFFEDYIYPGDLQFAVGKLECGKSLD